MKTTAAWDFGNTKENGSDIGFFNEHGSVIKPEQPYDEANRWWNERPDLAPEDMCRECEGEGYSINAYDEEESCKWCKGLGYIQEDDYVE